MKRLIFSFVTIALAVTSAASYNVTLYQKSQIGDKQLQPGDYRVEVRDNVAIFSQGKQKTEAAVKVETTDRKADSTSVRYGNNSEIQQIRLRGTNTTLVFTEQNAQKTDKDKISMVR